MSSSVKVFRLIRFKPAKLYSSAFALILSPIHFRGYPQCIILTQSQAATIEYILQSNPEAVIFFEVRYTSNLTFYSVERIYKNG